MKRTKPLKMPQIKMKSSQTPMGFHLLVKPTGAACNLDCKYCFFLSKETLYPGSSFRMTNELLKMSMRQQLDAQRMPDVSINWQGGEPSLMGLDFFQHSVEYVEKYKRPDQQVQYTIQTNGIKIDQDWAAFFKEQKFLVGLSLDGPQEMHDAYRLNKGGQGSFDQVMRGWEILMHHGVDVNILCTVNAVNADQPLELYHFFRDTLSAQYVQFIPIIERATAETLALANQGWSEPPGTDRPLYTQVGDLVTERSVMRSSTGDFSLQFLTRGCEEM